MLRERTIAIASSLALLVSTIVGVGTAVTFRTRAETERAEKEKEIAARQRVEGEKGEIEKAKAELEGTLNEARAKLKDAEDRQRRTQEDVETKNAEARVRRYIAQVNQRLEFVNGYYTNMGYSRTHSPKVAALPHGQSDSFTLTLRAGWQYRLVSACDSDCADIDIQVFDGNGNLISSDSARDNLPVVTINVNQSGEFRIKVTMYRCNSSPCIYGIGVYGKSLTS